MPLIGDWCIIIAISILLFILFKQLWPTTPAKILRIRAHDHIHGEYDLNQKRTLKVSGEKGSSLIQINQGKVRFKHAPCNHQYCVRQGWLSKANQISICMPNQISIELLGDKKPYDSLNY